VAPGLFGYIVRRLLWAIPVLFAISFIVFVMIRAAPGDPVDTLLGHRYNEETAERLRQHYGYDQPIVQQYFTYMGNLLRGDLGISTRHTDFSAREVILPRVWVSTQLGIMALIIAFSIGIPTGIYAALARGTFLDPLTISFWLAIDAVPVFVAIPILQYLFVVQLGLFDLSWEGVWSTNIILPVAIMSLPGIAGIARFMRASIISVMTEDYVRTARAKGLRQRTIVVSHITRNAMLPMITVIGLSLPGVATGSLFVELFFGIPGIAREALQAILHPDYDVILFLVLFGSTMFVLANIAVDVAYGFIDPRVRVGQARGG
jgi:ABC-type dipeptide/oligopeptide/nickel transport system permease component